jgi:crotonobetainyl-CoA:carnitine CoA-transferase CaiB-like acyl-CoA transferase
MGPLEGIRVLDLSQVVVGPYCTMLLGDLGAEVIKVERPDRGDDTRAWGPPFVESESAYFLSLNRNKKSVTLNLKEPEGLKVLLDLAAKSDVLVQNFKPGTLERLGAGYETISKVNPKIIYCSISAYGPTGPYKDYAGYDVIVSAIGGMMSITGERDGPPTKVGVAITDVATGMLAHGSIIAALYARDKTGKGQQIDLSLLETQVSVLINQASNYLVGGMVPHRWGTCHPSIVPYRAFEAKDNYVVVGAGNDSLYQRFCAAVGHPEWAEDPRFLTNPDRVKHRDVLEGMIQEILQTRTAEEWFHVLSKAGVPCGPVNTLDRTFQDPQVLHRDMVHEIDHATAGRIKLTGLPVKFGDTPAEIRIPPPTLGQHTDEVLENLLGYDGNRIKNLRSGGMI